SSPAGPKAPDLRKEGRGINRACTAVVLLRGREPRRVVLRPVFAHRETEGHRLHQDQAVRPAGEEHGARLVEGGEGHAIDPALVVGVAAQLLARLDVPYPDPPILP